MAVLFRYTYYSSILYMFYISLLQIFDIFIFIFLQRIPELTGIFVIPILMLIQLVNFIIYFYLENKKVYIIYVSTFSFVVQIIYTLFLLSLISNR